MKEPFLFSGTISNCYDSHVHWRATGANARRLNLRGLRSVDDLATCRILPIHYLGSWIIGFGWDQNLFADKKFPTREALDKRFGDTPVYFTRVDGHAVWVNTAAMQLSGVWEKNLTPPAGGKILLDDEGYPTGIFIDHALQMIATQLPLPKTQDLREDLLVAQTVFHRAGFTHIRDLTCDEAQWEAASILEETGQLRLAVEQFFSADNIKDFEARVKLCLRAKTEAHKFLRPQGVKVYFDGALGSEGAWISRSYNSGSGCGLQLLDEYILSDMMRVCFENDVDLAVHVIGDEAAHRVAQVALKLKGKNRTGQLHLEHVELLRPETIAVLRNIKVVCHMQPCHWLSDKVWLKDKIGDLVQHAFRWRDLEDAGVPFYFGSDTPIEETSLQRNLNAVLDAHKNGLPMPISWTDGPNTRAHSHPDKTWCPDTFTEFQNGSPLSLHFRGERLAYIDRPHNPSL